jgi:single-strand DNA-binding protein
MQLNQVNVLARLTADPETRHVGSSTVTRVRLAINGRPYKKDGEYKQDTTFIDADAWGQVGELIAAHFTKGKPILLTNAELRLDQWEDKTSGEKRSKHYLRIQNFDFVNLGGGKKDEGGEGGVEEAEATAPAAAPKKTAGRKKPVEAPTEAAGDDSEIPF